MYFESWNCFVKIGKSFANIGPMTSAECALGLSGLLAQGLAVWLDRRQRR
jgi:hypothetical protein